MNFEAVAGVILFFSLLGVGIIIFRKIPLLAELSEAPADRAQRGSISLNLKEKVKALNPFKYFPYEIFLQKILSKIRILTLKTENKTGSWLQGLRERTQKKKNLEKDNYWDELKKPNSERDKNSPR